MPPRKRAPAASKATTTSTKDVVTTKKTTATATKKSATSTSKASEKKGTVKAAATTKSTKENTTSAKPRKTKAPVAAKKRKAEDISEEHPHEPKKARVTQARAPKPKPKVVINQAPTTRLNVYVFGEGSSGELGLGATKNAIDVKRPRLNPLLPADKIGVVHIAVGGMHCLALTHDNKILTWGVNDQGALGRDTTWEGGYRDIDDTKSGSDSDDESDSGLNPYESTPTAIPTDSFPEGTVFVEVAAGDSASFALTDDGQVYGWGTFRVSRPNERNIYSTELTMTKIE